MHRFWKVFLLAIVFSFGWGAWWGFYNYKKNSARFDSDQSVRVLALKGFFTPRFIEKFDNETGIQLNVTEVESDFDLIREILVGFNKYDLFQLNSFISKSFLLDNVLTPIPISEIKNWPHVSVDFKSLDYDPKDEYLVPVSWGLNGFLINASVISLKDESLEELLAQKAKIAVMSTPVDLLNLSIKIMPIIKTWVETGQTEELAKDLKELRARLNVTNQPVLPLLQKGELAVAQIPQAKVAQLVGEKSPYRYVLPKERAVMWISLIGISRGHSDLELATETINYLLDDDLNQLLIEENEQATPLVTLNDSKLPLLQKAEFIRKVPLSRVELFINPEAYEPTWLKAVQDFWQK